jgi:hypothetical protein
MALQSRCVHVKFDMKCKHAYNMVSRVRAQTHANTYTHTHTCMQVKDLAAYDMVGLFFSGHWCPPSQKFTPLLAHAYKTMRAAGKNLEIVFLSSDHDQAQEQN